MTEEINQVKLNEKYEETRIRFMNQLCLMVYQNWMNNYEVYLGIYLIVDFSGYIFLK